MKKYIKLSLKIIIVLLMLCTTSFANNSKNAKVTQSNIALNGQPITCRGFNIDGNNYFKLRDLAEQLSGTRSGFDVIWNEEQNTIEVITKKAYTPVENEKTSHYNTNKDYLATPTESKFLVDGQLHSITAFNIDNSNYFKLRDLGNIIPFDVDWNGSTNTIHISSKQAQNAYKVEIMDKVNHNAVSSHFPRWSSTINSYLINNDDQTKSVIEAKDVVTVETYDKQHKLISTKSIEYELPLFGGFYSGEKYNYIAFGQNNNEEDNNKEVIRIVRYDKNFNRIDSVSTRGGESYTVVPFDAGSGRMAEHGDTLVFHTARKRYKTSDGLNHQSQLTIVVDTSTMTVTNDTGRFQNNHVSHSFDQYALFDGNEHVLVDHGDAYPRSIVLSKGDGKEYNNVSLFEIPGAIGANCTGVSVGGFEKSSENYIVAMNTIDHSLVSEYTSFTMKGLDIDQRDIIICTVPKNSINNSSVNQITIAKYIGSDKIASIPQLVKISDTRLMVMWQEYSKDNIRGDLKYVLVDEYGNPISDIQVLKKFVLSKCKPIVFNNEITWYTNEGGIRTFYSVALD